MPISIVEGCAGERYETTHTGGVKKTKKRRSQEHTSALPLALKMMISDGMPHSLPLIQ
jgi:hypothetical protein